MGAYTVRRLGSSIFLIFIVSFFSFLVLLWIPGDPVQLMLGTEASPDIAERLRSQLGLDRPWYIQYGEWFQSLLIGDLGESFFYGQPVDELISERLLISISLSFYALVLTLFIAFSLGILASAKRGSVIDYFIQGMIQVGLAVPSFWVAILLVLLFAVVIPVFPASGYISLSEGLIPHLKSIALPALSLAVVEAAGLTRMIRGSMLTVLTKDYMIFAKTKGLSLFRLYTNYALRNSLIGPITLIGMQAMSLISGVVIIENIFAIPGLGRLLLVAVQQRDLVLLQGIVIVLTIIVIVVNFLVDVLYSLIDPRIQLHENKE